MCKNPIFLSKIPPIMSLFDNYVTFLHNYVILVYILMSTSDSTYVIVTHLCDPQTVLCQ